MCPGEPPDGAAEPAGAVTVVVADDHPIWRDAVERDLVEEYRAQLIGRGVDYAADDCWRDYRLGTLHGMLIAVIATVVAEQTERSDDLFVLMATRHGRHAIELDALSLLE